MIFSNQQLLSTVYHITYLIQPSSIFVSRVLRCFDTLSTSVIFFLIKLQGSTKKKTFNPSDALIKAITVRKQYYLDSYFGIGTI